MEEVCEVIGHKRKGGALSKWGASKLGFRRGVRLNEVVFMADKTIGGRVCKRNFSDIRLKAWIAN